MTRPKVAEMVRQTQPCNEGGGLHEPRPTHRRAGAGIELIICNGTGLGQIRTRHLSGMWENMQIWRDTEEKKEARRPGSRNTSGGFRNGLFHDNLEECIDGKGIIELHPIDDRQDFPSILRLAESLKGLAQAPLGRGPFYGKSIGLDIDPTGVR